MVPNTFSTLLLSHYSSQVASVSDRDSNLCPNDGFPVSNG